MNWPAQVRVVEVGPRDGLQNEPVPLSVAQRVALIETLAEAGLASIECGSFVSARWVPQMAATEEVFRALTHKPNVSYSALVPNERGLDAAIQSNVKEIAVFASASESFSKQNINCTIDNSLERLARVALAAARQNSMRVRGYVSCVLGCPYEGHVDAEAVVHVTQALIEMGCYEVSLGDTIGAGTAKDVQTLIGAIARKVSPSRLAGHFHDTYGQALANVLAALDAGISTIDSSVAGLGGCPYAPGAAGNVASEDVIYLLRGLGVETGVDLDRLVDAGAAICQALGKRNRSRTAEALISSRGR